MKTLGSLLNSYQDRISTLCGCVKIVRLDGTTYRFTSLDRNIVVDGEEYISSYAFNPTAFSSALGLQIENMEIEGPIDEYGINDLDIVKNLFYNAEVWYFVVDYKNIAYGKDKILYGTVGEIRVSDKQFLLEIRGMSKKYVTLYSNYHTKMCRAKLGDSKCGVDLNNYKLFGTVVGSDPTSFLDGKYIYLRFKSNVGNSWTKFYEIKFKDNLGQDITPVNVSEDENLDPYYRKCTTESVPADPNVMVDGNLDTFKCINVGTSYNTTYFIFEFSKRVQISSIEIYSIDVNPLYPVYSVDIRSSLDNFVYKSDLFLLLSTYTTLVDTYDFANLPIGSLLSQNITSRYMFISYEVANSTKEDNYFQYGRIEWLTGLNSGTQTEIISSDGGGKVQLAIPSPYDIHAGDTFYLYPGCNHLLFGADGSTNSGHCKSKFNNVINFRGEPYIPNEDILLSGYIAVKEDREAAEGEQADVLQPVE